MLYKDFDIVLYVGELRVTMVGMKEDINVTVTPLGNNKYRCTYTPQHTGMLCVPTLIMNRLALLINNVLLS